MRHIAAGGDPFEHGSARPLDFGHWAAHKLEALTGYELRHGEAVAIGMALDTRYSVLAGLLPPGEDERVRAPARAARLRALAPALRRARCRRPAAPARRPRGVPRASRRRADGHAARRTSARRRGARDGRRRSSSQAIDWLSRPRRSRDAARAARQPAPHLLHQHPSRRELGGGRGRTSTRTARGQARVSPDAPFGVGLRLSGRRRASSPQPARARPSSRAFLAAHGLYVFTLNGFPYGAFHGTPREGAVYEPDWRTPERLATPTTRRHAGRAAARRRATAASAPCRARSGQRARRRPTSSRDRRRMLRRAAHLHALRARTGKTSRSRSSPSPAASSRRPRRRSPSSRSICSRRARCALLRLDRRSAGAAAEPRCAPPRPLPRRLPRRGRVRGPGRSARAASRGAGIASPSCSSARPCGSRRRRRRRGAARAVRRRRLPAPDGRARATARSRATSICPRLRGAARAARRGGEWRVHFHVPIFLERSRRARHHAGRSARAAALCRERRSRRTSRSRPIPGTCCPPALAEARLPKPSRASSNGSLAELRA